MKQKTFFLLNLVLFLVLASVVGFLMSKLVFQKELDKTIKTIEESSSKRVNFADEKNQKIGESSIVGSISYNLSNKIWFVVNKKNISSKNIIDQIYFKEDFITPAVVVTNDGWLVCKKLVNTKNIALINEENKLVEIERVVNDDILGLSYIKTNKTGLNPIGITDSSYLEVGQNIYAIKPNLYNYQNDIINTSIRSLHSNFISNKNDLIHRQDDIVIYGMLSSFIDDGIVLVNKDSEMLGITINNSGNTYFVPSKYIRYSLTRLFNNDKNIDYSTLGVSYIDLSEVVTTNSYDTKGAYIYDSVNILIKRGDIIKKVNNDVLNEVRALNTVLLDYNPGTEVTLTILRDSKEQELKVKLSTLKK